jgi:DNA-binding protein
MVSNVLEALQEISAREEQLPKAVDAVSEIIKDCVIPDLVALASRVDTAKSTHSRALTAISILLPRTAANLKSLDKKMTKLLDPEKTQKKYRMKKIK